MEKKAGSSGSTEISKTSRTRVTRKSARACQDTCADLRLRRQPICTLSHQTTPLAKQLTSRSEMPCPVTSLSHWRVPPKRPSMQMDRPARRQAFSRRLGWNGFQSEPGGCDVTSRTHGEPATPLSSRCGAVRFEGEPCVACASRSEIAASVGKTCQKSAWASHAWCALFAKIGMIV